MGRILLLVGLPRSGKTTVANILAKKGWAIVCPDNVRIATHGQAFKKDEEAKVWDTVRIMTKALLLSGNDVVIDATNITKERRMAWKSMGADILIHEIHTPKKICIARTVFGNTSILIDVINRMAHIREAVSSDEGELTNVDDDGLISYPKGVNMNNE